MSWFFRKKPGAAVDEAAPIIIDLAKEFFDLLLSVAPNFHRAFYRFDVQPGAYGGKASYESSEGVFLISTAQNREALEVLGRIAHDLIRSFGKETGIGLLTVKSNFEYDVQFEWSNLNRWDISKLNGRTGIPDGI